MANYINNRDYYNHLSEYCIAYKEATLSGNEPPAMSRYIIDAIMLISRKMASSYRFTNYTFKEDMIGDAIIKCYTKIHLFDPVRFDNPLAYTSQIIWNAFIGKIKEEQKQSSIKAKVIRETLSSEFAQHATADEETANAFVTFLKENEVYVDYFEEKVTRSDSDAKTYKHKNKSSNKKIIVENDSVAIPADVESLVVDLSRFEE